MNYLMTISIVFGLIMCYVYNDKLFFSLFLIILFILSYLFGYTCKILEIIKNEINS